MATLGDYLKRAAIYAGIGAGTTAIVVGGEPAIARTIQPELNSSTGIEQRLKEAPKPPRKIRYPGGVAYAQERDTVHASPSTAERVSIDEYYKRAEPSDYIAPGVRIGPFKQPNVKTIGFGFIENEWSTFYKNRINLLYNALREINGKSVSNGVSFDSQKIIEFIETQMPYIKGAIR